MNKIDSLSPSHEQLDSLKTEDRISSQKLDELIEKCKNSKDTQNCDNKEIIEQVNKLMNLFIEYKNNKPIPTQLAKELQKVVWKACDKK